MHSFQSLLPLCKLLSGLAAPRVARAPQHTARTLLLPCMVVMEAALKILVVDDNPLIRCCMSFIFAASHYEVTSARDGNDALARLDANPDGYDVIIVDQKMPQLSGVELVREIRKKGIRAKIMVLSAHLSPEIREAYEQLNVPVILDKPFNIQDLRLVVDRLAA